eukprot:TRINITY_DN4646_c0_g1_i2.p1 TRINITY_DN4646_c0_g1~~TRINITY_DN4646_c0_g1_i2.p1  ORF type:complete len:169 (+),score=48.82 TRINITY_DN4646_c0_g1_i2:82-588(+)
MEAVVSTQSTGDNHLIMALVVDGVESLVNLFKSSKDHYIAFEVDASTLNKVGSGDDGLNGLLGLLDPKKIIFSLFRVVGVDEEGSVREKFIFLSWIGAHVSSLKKAKVSVQKPQVLSAMGNFSCQFEATDPSDLDVKDICKELNRSSGAHKPNYYDFGSTKFYLSQLE